MACWCERLNQERMERMLAGLSASRYARAAMPDPRFRDLYHRLLDANGPQQWWPAESPLEVIVGAFLTQRTAWRNATLAIEALKRERLLSVEALARVPADHLRGVIRPAGFVRAKSRALQGFAGHVNERHGGVLRRFLALPTDALREELLSLFGVGEETADAILVYAAKRPGFVIDAYTRRLLSRLGWSGGDEPYGQLRDLFTESLPVDAALHGELHALIVEHGKRHCRARPRCEGCPLRSICAEAERDGTLGG